MPNPGCLLPRRGNDVPGVASLSAVVRTKVNNSDPLNLTTSWTNGQFRVLTHTNVNEPVINWELLSTNTYDGNGTLTVTNPVNPGELQRFFRTVEP